jgi:hypothetical protein
MPDLVSAVTTFNHWVVGSIPTRCTIGAEKLTAEYRSEAPYLVSNWSAILKKL